MGAIFGVAGLVVMVVLIATLWMTGAMRPKSEDRPSPAAKADPTQSGRTTGID